MNRRQFAGMAAGVAAAARAFGQGAAPGGDPNPQSRQGTLAESAPFGGTLEFTRRDVAPKIEPFPMTAVRLLPGSPFAEAAESNRAYMSRLKTERLVHNFRLNAGLASSAAPLGGWEDPKGELRGHFTGHYLSAMALTYASTGDREAKAKGETMVADLAACQEKLGGGYLSAFPREFWDRLDARRKVWAPFYTIHKIFGGMFDMYQFAGSKEALKVAEGMAGWADEWTASKSEAHMQEILKTEFGGMSDVLYKLAAATGNNHWATVGDRFTKKDFVNPLALHRDQLRGLHVNTHIPQVIGAARRYEMSGDMRFHDVADFFWNQVTGSRCYVTGGTSNNEGWLTQPGQLAAELARSTETAECCCAYNMMKLTRHLHSWNANPRYFDYYERALVNHRLGTIERSTGHTQYYLSHTPGAWRTFNHEDQSFWCCTGSGVEEYSKLTDSIYWRDKQGVFVNLFIPSELTSDGLRLQQHTKFPEEQGTTLTIAAAKPGKLTLRIRVPSWVDAEPIVKLNGRALETSASPGSYVAITRGWAAGDRVEMSLPMSLRVETMPDDPGMQAFLRGPVLLAGDLGPAPDDAKLVTGPEGPDLKKMPMEMPAFKKGSEDALVPFYKVAGRRYTIYWKVS